VTPERLREIEALFHEARERTPAERDAFLARACAGDPALRREVESLLAQPPGGMIDAPVGALVAALVPPSPPHLAPGTPVGPYRIERLLAVGGMGEVYRARDTSLGRDVAIKILPPRFTDTERLARLEREARMLAALNHPHIAAIHGTVDGDGVRGLVLELVEGETLADRIRRGPAPIRHALAIARQIADAVDAAHEQGIVHRDLKPANIRITPDGVVKVLDFGLAKATSGVLQSPAGAAGGTVEGTILGTAAYMSPEQARGQAIDKRTDIWAFGCVLYEMLTGRAAFAGDTVSDTIVAILEREPDFAALPAATPPTIARLLRRCLERDTKRRLRDIGDAVAEIDDALDGGNAPAVMAGRAPVVSSHSWWSRWIAIVLVALAAAALGWRVSRLDAPRDNPLSNATFTRLTNFQGDEAEAALSPDGKFATFLSDRDGPLDVWLTQVGSGRFVNLSRETHIPGLRPVRNVGFSSDGSEIWFGGAPVGRMRIMPMMGGSPRPFLVDRAVEVAWSSDGGRMVYHTDAPGDPMFVADRAGVGAAQIFVDPIEGGHLHHQTWSPDGRWIYFARGVQSTRQMDLWRIAASGGQPERLTYHDAYVGFPTPIDDRTVLYTAQDRDGSGPWLWALDTKTRATRRAAYGTEQYLSLAGSVDRRRLVAAVANRSASLWTVPILDRPAEDGDVKPMTLPTVRALAPRLAGRSLFYLSSQGTGDGLWRFEDGRAVEILKGSGEALLEPPAVSADGRRLAVVLRRDGKRRLRILAADGGDLQSLAEPIDIEGSVCWSPDARWIVAGGIDDRGPGLFKIPLDRGAPVRLLAGTARDPVWSPSGDLIVYTGANVSVDAPLLAIRADGTKIELPAIRLRVEGQRYRFVPDGRALVYTQGPFPAQNFWLLDLATKESRQLTRLNDSAATQSFDVTADGREIVFDRLRENSDVVLIELAR